MPRRRQDPPSLRFMPIGKQSEIDWGNKLVKSWILNPSTRPANLTELIAQCDEHSIFYDHPDSLSQNIYFFQKGKDEMSIRLPARELFEEGQKRIREGFGTYPLPEFYDDFFATSQLDELSTEKALELHSARTGEYSINGCA